MAWIVCLTVSCDRKPLQKIRDRGEITVLTRNAPTTYYEDRDGIAGLEYEMAAAFAEYLDVDIQFRVLDSIASILETLEKGEGDLAAAGLTQRTARSLKVNDRLNPEQSIMAGSRYLVSLRKRLPEEIREPDRTWISLAAYAYNVVMGHIHDAQTLARQLDKNPYLWKEFKTVLLLLSQKRYYRNLKHGYARGSEPVRYVQRIRNFQDILDRQIN